MSLSTYLQKKVFAADPGHDLSALKRLVLDTGKTYYRDHPDERRVLGANLRAFGIDAGPDVVDEVAHHILLHYYEKLIALFSTPQGFADYLDERVDDTRAVETIARHQADGRAVLLAVPHYGGVELVTPTFLRAKLPITAALRFQTEELSRNVNAQAEVMEDSSLFGHVEFIEVGKPGVPAALEMAGVMRRGGILLSVFDERTEYSIPVSLLGRQVWGGAGLHKLLAFSRAPHALCAVFMKRTDGERYALTLEEVPADHTEPVQALYDHLEAVLTSAPEQWYFLHEEIPFVADSDAA